MQNRVAEIIRFGLRHSVAQAFLIFSGLLVVISMLWAKEYIDAVFFTLFYALIAHSLTALRKHESLGKYAGGNNKGQIVLFTLINISLFAWWSTGVWSKLFDLGSIKLCYPPSLDLPCLSSYALASSLVLIAVWVGIFFYKIFSEERRQTENGKDSYKVSRSCNNCDNDVEVDIPRGVSFENYPCPNCGVTALKKPDDSAPTV